MRRGAWAPVRLGSLVPSRHAVNPHLAIPLRSSGAPLADDNPVILAVHGRNQGPDDILDVVASLDWPEATVVVPTADAATWYPDGFMVPFEANEPRLTHALDAVDEWVRGLAETGVARDRLVLLGFSQGACLVAEYTIRNPARYRGIAILTGGAIGPEGTTWDEDAGSFDGTPVFFGTSDVDAWVPEARVHETAAVFDRMGAAVTLRVYPLMPHHVSAREAADCRAALA